MVSYESNILKHILLSQTNRASNLRMLKPFKNVVMIFQNQCKWAPEPPIFSQHMKMEELSVFSLFKGIGWKADSGCMPSLS